MRNITLEIPERIVLIGIFNDKELKGDIETLRAVLDDIPKISISEEEKKEIGFTEIKDADGEVSSFKWDKPNPIDVELNDKTIDLVVKYIDLKSKANQLSLTDYVLFNLFDKLKKE